MKKTMYRQPSERARDYERRVNQAINRAKTSTAAGLTASHDIPTKKYLSGFIPMKG